LDTIVDFDDIVGAKLIILEANNTNVVSLTCTDANGDYYAIAIPNVIYKKFEKEEVTDGEGRVGHTGVSETTDGEKESSSDVGEEDNSGDASEDQGTATGEENS